MYTPTNYESILVIINQSLAIFNVVVRYPLGREGVYAPSGPVCILHALDRVISLLEHHQTGYVNIKHNYTSIYEYFHFFNIFHI